MLRPAGLYEFVSGELKGYVRERGEHAGLEILAGHAGRPISTPGHPVFGATHLLRSGRGEAILPARGKVEGDTLSLEYATGPELGARVKSDYDFSTEGRVDVCFTVSFTCFAAASHEYSIFSSGTPPW